MQQVLIGILLVLGIFSYYLYNENITLKTNNAALEGAVEMQKEAMETIKNDFELQSTQLNELSLKSQAAQRELNRYSQFISEYKLIINDNHKYKLSKKNTPNTLVLESAISTIEVHEDDENWNPYAPVPMGLNVVSFNSYIEEDVRLLGEKRLIDTQSGKVLTNSMDIQKNVKIIINGDVLTFKDIQPALDSWLDQVREDLK